MSHKRNQLDVRRGREARRSPYAKYDKRPHQYSELFRRWKAAKQEGKDALADSLSRDHAARYLRQGDFA